MRTIAVTGAESFVGRRLLARLRERDDIERVLALDIRPPAQAPAGVDVRVGDVRDPDLATMLAGCDAVVHLAFVHDDSRDQELMRDVNVRGTRNVCEAAAAAGVPRIVLLSSAMVYGAHGDNDVPIAESAALRGNDDLASARHRVEIEQWVAGWAEQDGMPSVAVLRPAVLAGPGATNLTTRRLESLPFVTIRGHRPPVQFSHVDDVVRAVELLLERPELTGPFNCACEGWLSADEFLAISRVRHVELPVELAHQVVHRAWRLGLSPFAPGLLGYAMHPWVTAVGRLVEAGWRPTHTNRDVLAEMVTEHREHIALGPVRVRRQDVKRGALVTGAAAVSLLALRRWRASR